MAPRATQTKPEQRVNPRHRAVLYRPFLYIRVARGRSTPQYLMSRHRGYRLRHKMLTPASALDYGLNQVITAAQQPQAHAPPADHLIQSASETSSSSGVFQTASSFSPPTPLDPTWGAYHIAGSGMQGLHMDLQMLPGYPMPSGNGTVDPWSPGSLWNDLLGPWIGSDQSLGGSASMPRPEAWSAEQWTSASSPLICLRLGSSTAHCVS